MLRETEIKGGIKKTPDSSSKFCWLCHYSHYLEGFQNVSEMELGRVSVQQTAAARLAEHEYTKAEIFLRPVKEIHYVLLYTCVRSCLWEDWHCKTLRVA